MNRNFEKFLYLRKGLGKVTVDGHLHAIARISRVLGTNRFTRAQAEDYVFDLYQSPRSYSHKSNQAKAIEHWFEFKGAPIRFARQRKPKPTIKQTLSEAEVMRLFLCCKNIREKAIISTLAYGGLRPKELCALHVRDIDFSSNELKVIQGKGLKDGIVYVGASCIKILLEYLTAWVRSADNLLFETVDGLRPYNTQCLRKFVHTVARRAGFIQRVWPYLLRHSLGTNIVLRGGDIFMVKRQLRHEDIMTSLGYIHTLGYGIKNDHERFLPAYW